MSTNDANNINTELSKDNPSNANASTGIKKITPSHVAKSKLLRQKLREKKNKEEAVKGSTLRSNDKSPEPNKPINTSNSSSNNNISTIKEEAEKIDPLKFVFSCPSENYQNINNNLISINNLPKEEEKKENIIIENMNNVIQKEIKEEKNILNENNEKKIEETEKEIKKEEPDINNVKNDSNINGEVIRKDEEKSNEENKEIKEVQNIIIIPNDNIQQEIKDNNTTKKNEEKSEVSTNINKGKEEDVQIQKLVLPETITQPVRNGVNREQNISPQTKSPNSKIQEEKNSDIPAQLKNSNIPLQLHQKPQKEEKKEPIKQFKFPKIVKQHDSDFSSSSDDDDDFNKKEEQRLMNKKHAQENLFKKNDIIPKSNFLLAKKKDPELTKADILEKLFLDFDKTSELLELNEKKKQIMLKKMRRTLHRLSNLRPRNLNPDEEEKSHLIRKKIEELQNLSGDNYDKIKGNVEKIVLNLKLPDYYFEDDDDVERISDKDQKADLNIKTILDVDFVSFMRQ